MILSKYQEKQLRYRAKANKPSVYHTISTPNGKVKHREFVGLSYDESKDSSGMVILTNIVLHGMPFDGTYEELLERLHTPTDIVESNDVSCEGCPIVTVECLTSTDSACYEDTANIVVTYEDFDETKCNKFCATLESNGIETEVYYEGKSTAKKILSRAELNSLRIKCATMHIALMYGEPADSTIDTIVHRYPDAIDKLNSLYSKDGIKPYTISEDALRNAYPDEFKHLAL